MRRWENVKMRVRQSGGARAWIWATSALLAASIASIVSIAPAQALAEEAREPAPATAPREAREPGEPAPATPNPYPEGVDLYPDDVDIDTLLAEAIPEVFGKPEASEPVEPVEPDSWIEKRLPPEVAESWARLLERIPVMAARGFSATKAHVPPPMARQMDQVVALA